MLKSKLNTNQYMKKEMTYNVFIDDQLRPYDVFNKTNNPLYKQQFVVVKSFSQFTEYVEEQFKKDGSYPGFISFDFYLSPVTMQVTDDYSVYLNEDSYKLSGLSCAQWIVNFVRKNNLPIPKYIIHDVNTTGRRLIQKVFNNPTTVIDPFVSEETIESPINIETKTIHHEIPIAKVVVKRVEPNPVPVVKIEPKKVEPKKDDSKTPIQQHQYWTSFKEFLEKNKSIVKIKKPLPQYWINFPVGKSEYYISAMVSSREPSLTIILCFMGADSKTNFEKVKKLSYTKSFSEIDKNIIWDKMDGKKMSGVSLKIDGDFTNENDREKQFTWFMTNLEKFVNYFRPIIKEM